MTFHRETDVTTIKEAMAEYAHELIGWDADEWVPDTRNICLVDGRKNYAFAQWDGNDTYYVHAFFHDRGGYVRDTLKKMLAEMFIVYDAKVLKALGPMNKPHARMMDRLIGMKSMGEISAHNQDLELFILTRPDFLASLERITE